MTITLGEPAIDFDAAGAGWTAREIAQQPALWREVARTATSDRAATDSFLRPLLEQRDLRIVLTGAGTSAFAGEVLAPYLARERGRRVEAISTTDLVSNPREHFAEDVATLLVSFARSGDSPESVAATELADRCLTRCHHLVLTCNSRGELHARHSTEARSLIQVMPAASNDRGFAMTSSFTCMVLSALLTLGTGAHADSVERLAAAAEDLLTNRASGIRVVAERGYSRIVYLGSGPLTGIARESALKMLELTAGRVATWHDSPLGFRHGPKSVLDDRTLVVVYLSNDGYTRAYDLDIVAELRERLGRQSVIAVSGSRTQDDAETWSLTGLAGLDDAALSLPFVVCAQLLALQTSLSLGLAPDNPFPGGEVNRVVQGVTIHPFDGQRT